MKKFLLIILFCSQLIFAQNKNDERLSGILYADSKITFDNSFTSSQQNSNFTIENRKSPLLAAVLSFTVPGAGEFYSGSYIKTAAFIAVEAAAITVGLMYNKKGDDQTNFFQSYAENHWSVQRYAQWTLDHATIINSNVDPSKYNVFNNGKINWDELNRLEGDLGSFYSHRLAYHGEQQYYEMIGKYQQFYHGWDDADPSLNDYQQIKAKLDAGGTKFMYYSVERGKANDYYNIASKAVIVIVANHIISALDAAWSASRYNKNLEVSAKLKKFDLGYSTLYYPQLNLQYNF
jgi:hypothetical protein